GCKLTVRGYPIDRVRWSSREIPLLSEAAFSPESPPPGGSPLVELLEDLLWWTHLTRLEATYPHIATAMWRVLDPRWRANPEPMDEGFRGLYRILSHYASHSAGAGFTSPREVAR